MSCFEQRHAFRSFLKIHYWELGTHTTLKGIRVKQNMQGLICLPVNRLHRVQMFACWNILLFSLCRMLFKQSNDKLSQGISSDTQMKRKRRNSMQDGKIATEYLTLITTMKVSHLLPGYSTCISGLPSVLGKYWRHLVNQITASSI